MIAFFVYLLVCYVKSDPHPPYWYDFRTGLINWIPSMYGEDWTYTADLTYKGSANKMRLDYWNFCEPHFNYTKPDNFFSCSYIFTDNTAFFRTSDKCCIFKKDFGAIRPDWLQKNAVFNGVKEMYHKKVNEWFVPGWQFHYYTDYYTNIPIGESGINVIIETQVPAMYFLYDTTTPINDTFFDLDKSCYVDCPNSL